VGPNTINTNQDSCWLLLLNTPFPAWQICTQSTSPWPSDGGSGSALAARGGIYGHAAAASPDGLSVFIYGGTLVITGQVSEDIYQFKVSGFADELTVDGDLFKMVSNINDVTNPLQARTPVFSNDGKTMYYTQNQFVKKSNTVQIQAIVLKYFFASRICLL
jgi:hypothetical protein